MADNKFSASDAGCLLFGLSLLPSVGYPLYGGYSWLRYGWTGTTPTLADWFGWPHVSWVGLQQLIDRFMNLPIYFSAPLVGLAAWGLFVFIAADVRASAEAAKRKAASDSPEDAA